MDKKDILVRLVHIERTLHEASRPTKPISPELMHDVRTALDSLADVINKLTRDIHGV